jgi:hypothetical protein
VKFRTYRVVSFAGTFGVDEYLDGQCVRTVACGLTKKAAMVLVNSFNDAIYYFCRDNGIEGV